MIASSDTRWTERIDRADHLADRHPAAADMLRFYATLAGYQRSLASRWVSGEHARASTDAVLRTLEPSHLRTVGRTVAPSHPRTVAPHLTGLLGPVLEVVADFLTWLEDAAPPRLAEAAVEMRRLERASWQDLVNDRLAHRGDATETADAPRLFVVEALLQPLAERLASERGPSLERLTPSQALSPARCPFCGDQPSVGALREEAEGAKRSLVCGLCLTEWPYLRLLCPACGEQRFDALPVFTSETVPGARIEACETCRAYVKTIDLTKDGHAVPCVDDLATVSLDLWARDQGYTRLRSNLLMT